MGASASDSRVALGAGSRTRPPLVLVNSGGVGTDVGISDGPAEAPHVSPTQLQTPDITLETS